VDVRTLLPPGVHPDTYEARPRDAEAIEAADLLVRVGGAADAWVRVPADMAVVEFTRGLTLMDGSDHDHGAGTGNPHVWLDPILVRDVLLPDLVEALARLAPDSAAAIRPAPTRTPTPSPPSTPRSARSSPTTAHPPLHLRPPRLGLLRRPL
jgi:ABC-type Zn uptake system ZnuABC Zn-binding protein ZnuA